jgi:hypothetical protein
MMAAPLRSAVEKPTNLDDLKLPDGRPCSALRGGELVRVLQRLGVPGVSPHNGRSENLAAYAAHVDAIKAEAAQNGLAAWLDKFKDAR